MPGAQLMFDGLDPFDPALAAFDRADGLRYDPDLDRLRDPRTGAFANVYRREGRQWRARVLNKINLGAYPTPADAARAVLAWHRRWYGPHWHGAFLARKSAQVRVRRVRRGGREGFAADVYYADRPVRVTRDPRAAIFPGRPAPPPPKDVSAARWDRALNDYLFAAPGEALAAARAVMALECARRFGPPRFTRHGRPAHLTHLLFWRCRPAPRRLPCAA